MKFQSNHSGRNANRNKQFAFRMILIALIVAVFILSQQQC